MYLTDDELKKLAFFLAVHVKRHLAENGVRSGAGVNVLRDAIALVEDRAMASIAA